MEFCRLFPDRVRGLLLADTAHRAETEEGRRERDAMADRLLREGMGPYADEVLTRMPTLIMVGSDDEYTPVAEARRMHELIAGSTLTVVEGTAHMPDLERPDEVNQALDDILRAL